jgi:tetratricopeptide (TPR) repeat protein/predicted Ser/Thr protein kinase
MNRLTNHNFNGNPPDDIRGLLHDQPDQWRQALAAHQALQEVLGDTPAAGGAGRREPPELPDDYEVECELGRGGMGVVYLARQRSLGRRVALKVLRPAERLLDRLVQRFMEEARHLARLRHPHIVSIHEVGDAHGEPYFTMDYIEGEPLSALISRGPLSPSQALAILKQVAIAVQHAHRQGIIHRDLKPSNVLLDSAGQAFVTDFGLARDVSQDSSITATGELLGTPQYMSPEQARGQTELIGEATDLHALGLLFYEMLAGQSPYRSVSPADAMVKLLSDEPPPLRKIDRRIPRELETICLKLLQKAPADRYSSVGALLEDIRRFEAGEPLLARRASYVWRIVRWVRLRWRTAAIALAAALVAFAIAMMVMDRSYEDLIAWGDEELAAGRHAVAAQVFQRALDRGGAAHRAEASERLARAIRELDDPQQAVDLALQIVNDSPRLSFGKYDFLVAQALVVEARAETKNGVFEPGGADAPSAKRDLAARRLVLFLEGPWGKAEERAEAERSMAAIRSSMQQHRPLARWSSDPLVQLPEGTAEQLESLAADATATHWDRGKALVALGQTQESQGNREEALASYRGALELLRPLYPAIEGVASSSQVSLRAGRDASAPECRMMRDLVEDIARLDADFSISAGGVFVSVEHPELIEGIDIAVNLEIVDPAIEQPDRGLPRNFSRYVALRGAEASPIKLLDGRYRVTLRGTSMSLEVGKIDSRLLHLDGNALTEEVEVRGEMVSLPPLHVRLLEETAWLSPAANARLDLTADSITWTAAPGAAYYEVQLGWFVDFPTPSATWFQVVRTTAPAFAPAELSEAQMRRLRDQWTAGRTIGCRVTAFDADGRPVAKTLEERRFLVARALPEAPVEPAR